MAVPLNRNSEGSVAEWMTKAAVINVGDGVSSAVVVNSDDDLVDARSKIEACAEAGKPFYFDASSESQGELREYASLCGLKTENVIPVSKEEISLSSNTLETRVAEESATIEDAPDPFGILEGFAPESSFEKNRDWDAVKPSDKLSISGKPSQAGSVGRLDGRETYEEQRIVGVRPGENSIASPEIQEPESADNAAVIRNANEKRKAEIAFDKAQWEKEALSDLPDPGIIAKDGVKLTGAGEGQPHGNVGRGQHSIFDPKDANEDMPERTRGERIADSSVARREAIQRPKEDDRSWDSVTSSKSNPVSDVFFNSLKEEMEKIK
jgi:hypothetical protein